MLQSLIESVSVDPEKENVKKSGGNELHQLVAAETAKALEPLYKSRGLATNLNNEPEPVKKEDDLFAGVFM